MMPRDHFRHDFPASRLQWPLAGAGQKPHALDGFGDGFATLFVKALKIEFFEWHKKYWVFILARS